MLADEFERGLGAHAAHRAAIVAAAQDAKVNELRVAELQPAQSQLEVDLDDGLCLAALRPALSAKTPRLQWLPPP